MTLFKLWLTFIVMENYEQKIIIPTNPQHATQFTPQWFLCQSHIITICYGVGKAMIQHIHVKNVLIIKFYPFFYLNKVKKKCILVQLGLVSWKKSSPKNLFNFFYHEMQESNLMDRFECS